MLNTPAEPQKRTDGIYKVYVSTDGTCTKPDASHVYEPASKCIKTSNNTD